MAQLLLFDQPPPPVPCRIRMSLIRYRGSVSEDQSFAILREGDHITWVGMPCCQVGTPEEVVQRIRQLHEDQGASERLQFIAGGSMTRDCIRFTKSEVAQEELYALLAGAFGHYQQPNYHLQRYETAEVRTPSGNGAGVTVADIVMRYGLEVH